MVDQAPAVERVRLPVRDLRVIGQGCGPVREGPRGGRVADLGGQPDAVRQQILDLVEFFGIVREPGQHVERLGQRAFLLEGLAAGQGQRADHPVPDPLGVRGGGGQVTRGAALVSPRWKQITAATPWSQQATPGSLVTSWSDAHLGQGVVPAAGVEQQLAESSTAPGPAGP